MKSVAAAFVFTIPVLSSVAVPALFAHEFDHSNLLAALPSLQTRFWIQTSRGTSLKALAAELDLPLTTLVVLNGQVASAVLRKGQWLILPTQVESRLSRSLSLDVSSIRRTAPVSEPPVSVAEVKVRRGDSIATIARTHGLSLTQFRKLNPGMDLARLVVGSTVRVAEAAPRQLLAIRPSVSSGASWPDLPSLPGAGVTRSSMPIGTTYSAPDSDQKQELRELIQKNRAAERLAAARKADAERQARVAREEKERQAREARMAAAARRYRKFDGSDCTYDWQSWGRSASGVRSVKSAYCEGVTEVAVDCGKLKVSLLQWGQWRPWKTPDPLMEPMVVEACANALGSAQPDYISPIKTTGLVTKITPSDSPASLETDWNADGVRLDPIPTAFIMPNRLNQSLEMRYRDAIRAQQEWLKRLQGR